MDVYKVRGDGTVVLLCAGLKPAEVYEFQEWISYTKPLGPSVKIAFRQASELVHQFTAAGFTDEVLDQDQPSRAA